MEEVLCMVATLLLIYSSSSLPLTSKLSLADYTSYNYFEPSGPGTYAFGYDIDDPTTNNVQFRNEERHPNGTVTGSYGYIQPDGKVRMVRYIADSNGYRATEESPYHLSMLKPINYPNIPFFLQERFYPHREQHHYQQPVVPLPQPQDQPINPYFILSK